MKTVYAEDMSAFEAEFCENKEFCAKTRPIDDSEIMVDFKIFEQFFGHLDVNGSSNGQYKVCNNAKSFT